MTARAHVAIRLTALAWIAAMAMLPRESSSMAKPDAVAPAVVAPPAAAHVHVLAPSAHGASLARR